MPYLDEVEALDGLGAVEGSVGRVRVVATGTEGRPDLAAALAGAPADAEVQVCGPEGLTDAVVAALAELRPGAEARLERFHPAGGAADQADAEVEVELARSGRTVTVPAARSVLGALREELPDLPYSCEQGFCGTCRATVLAGTPDHRGEALTEAEQEDSMLLCVSRSRDGRLVLDL
ncbi:flavin reductase family protein [Streptacidiphilus albus]|uniref:flavin reductase family protein n=1 Tax=Streptacidiphilus albus TaxID=105425 RepID=UPI0038B4C3E0